MTSPPKAELYSEPRRDAAALNKINKHQWSPLHLSKSALNGGEERSGHSATSHRPHPADQARPGCRPGCRPAEGALPFTRERLGRGFDIQ